MASDCLGNQTYFLWLESPRDVDTLKSINNFVGVAEIVICINQEGGMMQLANETEFELTAEFIDIKKNISEQKQGIVAKNKSKTKACFRTDARYFCDNTQCDCRKECKKLIAAWMR